MSDNPAGPQEETHGGAAENGRAGAEQNPDCRFILRGDFNDCAHAGGGRGANDAWCESCLSTKRTADREPYYMCVCGHSTYWHADGGSRDCEFGPECNCSSFRDVSRTPVCEYPHVEGEELCEGTCVVAGRCLGNDIPATASRSEADKIADALCAESRASRSDASNAAVPVVPGGGQTHGGPTTTPAAQLAADLRAHVERYDESFCVESLLRESATALDVLVAALERAEQHLAWIAEEAERDVAPLVYRSQLVWIADLARAVLAGSPDTPPSDKEEKP